MWLSGIILRSKRPVKKAAQAPQLRVRCLSALVACFLFILPLCSTARDFSRDFAVVFATEKTEARFGKIPLDRAVIASAIESAARYEAKGVVVKFFFDQPRSTEGDNQLVQSLSMIPVILQARIDDTQQKPNELPVRFTLGRTNYITTVQGSSGWIPLPALAEKSHAVCFTDFNSSPIPILETYRGDTVKALLLCSVEMALGQEASFRSDSEVKVGDFVIPLGRQNQVSLSIQAGAKLPFFQFEDLIDGTLPKNALKGRVVILGYDGPNIPTVVTPTGNVGSHRAFVLYLKALMAVAPNLSFHHISVKGRASR